jgi:hypothetical protein
LASLAYYFFDSFGIKQPYLRILLIIEIISPSVPKKEATQYEKQKQQKQFRAKTGIELVIDHIKHDHRMLRNY